MKLYRAEHLQYGGQLYPRRYGALELSANGNPATALIREHRPLAARQHRVDLGKSPVTTRLRAGTYTVVVVSRGYKPERRLVKISEAAVESVCVNLDRIELQPYVTAQERLSVKYGIRSPRPMLEKLVVGERQHVVLAREGKAGSYRIKIDSAEQLKRVMGNPDSLAASRYPVYGEVVTRAPREFQREKGSFEANAMLREFVDGNSQSVTPLWVTHLNELILSEILLIAVFAFNVVEVGPWGVLEIGNDSNILTCDLLRVHSTGTVRITGDQPVQIDAGEYESFS